MSVRPKSRVCDREANMTTMQLAIRDRNRRQQLDREVATILDRAATGWVELSAENHLVHHVLQARKRSGTWYETREEKGMFSIIRMDAYVLLLLDAARVKMVRVTCPKPTGSKMADSIERRRWIGKIDAIKHAAQLDSQRFEWSRDYYTTNVFCIAAKDFAKAA